MGVPLELFQDFLYVETLDITICPVENYIYGNDCMGVATQKSQFTSTYAISAYHH